MCSQFLVDFFTIRAENKSGGVGNHCPVMEVVCRMATVGERLKSAREYLGLRTGWVSAQVGIESEDLAAVEAGVIPPDTGLLKALASIYRYPASHFMGEAVGPDESLLVMARADRRLNDTDILELQRFSEFLRAIGTNPSGNGSHI